MMAGTTLRRALCSVVLATASLCAGQEPEQIGIDEQLGERIPLEALSFFDEDGEPLALQELFDRPIVLTLVYYRCPGICTPLLQEVARVADHCDLVPGEDYRLVTISFDPKETAELAQPKKVNMLAEMTNHQVPPDGWRFLTGDAENIRRITEAVGFRYAPDKNSVDFVHAATVIFLSPGGMIARYLNGTQFNPADLKLAVIDASEGRARSFMRKIERLCYSYDPEGQAYVLKINRLILGVTLLFVVVFVAFLVFRKVATRGGDGRMTGNAS
jgi:protein SCO1/2